MSERIKPIPTPLKLRWREFRIQALPFMVFLAVAVAVAILWRDQVAPGTMTGEVEGRVSAVTAPAAGVLAQVFVERFTEVEAGETVGQLIRTSPEVLHSSLAVLRAEIELTRLGWFDPVLDQQRNLLQVEQLKLDLLDKRAELAIRRIEMEQAGRTEERYARLRDQGYLSPEEFEQARSEAEILRSAVAEGEAVIEETERAVRAISRGDLEEAGVSEAIAATLRLHEEKLKLKEAQLRPVPLVAPISGTVGEIRRGNRSNLVEGETILTIRSPEPERIVAYAKEPLAFDPKVGMEVKVRARNAGQSSGTGKVLSVGAQVEPLDPAYQTPHLNIYESGLPVLISLPATLEARPGERVEVDILER